MTREIVVRPDYVEEFDINNEGERYAVRKRKPSDDFLKRLAHSILGFKKVQTTAPVILPMNCRFYKEFPNGAKLVIVEEAPAIRTILLKQDVSWAIEIAKMENNYETYGIEDWLKENSDSDIKKFSVAFPHIIYIFQMLPSNDFKNLYIFVRPTPIKSYADPLFRIPLPNTGDDNHVCMGPKGEINRKYVSTAIEGFINSYWNNIFNTDLSHLQREYQNNIPELSDPFRWQYLSHIDPMFVYRVEWIPAKLSVRNMINMISLNIKRSFTEVSPEALASMYGFNSFASTFNYTFETNIVQEDEEDGTPVTVTLEETATESWPFNDTTVYIGDKFRIKDKTYFIDCYLVDPEIDRIERVRLYREDGKRIVLRLRQSVIDLIERQILADRHMLQFEVNGEKFERDDIVSINFGYGEIYRKIYYFRYGATGQIEMRTSNGGLYLTSALGDNIRKVDLTNFELRGVKLISGERYVLHDSSYDRYEGIKRYERIIFAEFDEAVINEEGLSLGFKIPGRSRNNYYTLSGNSINKLSFIARADQVGKLPIIFRLGINMYQNNYDHAEPESSNQYWYKNRLLHTNMDYLYEVTRFSRIAQGVLFNKGTTFFVASDDGVDTLYNIGDKVVVSKSYDNPMDMLKVRTIVGFVVDQENEKINVVLQDREGNVSEFPLVNSNRSHGSTFKINYPALRHITNTYGDLKAGMKIQANKPGIVGFPKKNFNMIVGFLTDTGIDMPLVLCSNCLTYWPDQLVEDFDIFDRNHPDYSSMSLSPFEKKYLKPQPGDLIYYRGNYYYSPYKTVIMLGISKSFYLFPENKEGLNDYYDAKAINAQDRRVMKFVGFLSPRYSGPQIAEMRKVPGIATHLGTIADSVRNSSVRFPIDHERRIITS